MPSNFTAVKIVCPYCKEELDGKIMGGLDYEGRLVVRVEVDHKCSKPGR